MNGHQRFLCQILCLGRGSADTRKPPLIIAAQIGTEPAKKDTVSCGISAKARPHQAPKLGFVRYHYSSSFFVSKPVSVTKFLLSTRVPDLRAFCFGALRSKSDY